MFSTTEYTAPKVSYSSEYTELDSYYKGSQFGPQLPAGVPSMHYPTILDQSLPWEKYNALTHDTDGNNYYNVETAYGNTCHPKYFVAKCPSNKFIRPFVPERMQTTGTPTACPLRTEQISEGYTGATNTDAVEQLKNLRVLFFYDGSGRCPHSRSAIEQYKKQLGGVPLENVFSALKDIRHPHNEKHLTDLQGVATPFFFSQTTNKAITGFVPSLEELVAGLHGHSGGSKDLASTIRNLDLVVFVMEGCGWCRKLKDLFTQAGVARFVRFVDARDPAFKAEVARVQGFPHTKSNKTGKGHTGHPGSLDKLIQALQ